MTTLSVEQALKTYVDDREFYSEFSREEEWIVTAATDTSTDPTLHVPAGLPTTGIEPTYVSDYFKDNVRRPVVNIAKPPNAHPHSTMMELLRSNTVTLGSAKSYLCYIFRNKKFLLDLEWSSYQLVIGKAGHTVTISNILDLQHPADGAEDLAPGTAANPRESEIIWACIVLLSPYRINTGIRKDYRDLLYRRYSDILAEYESPLSQGWNISLFLADRMAWEQDEGFSRIAAAIDMLFTRFPSDPWAKIRFSTLGARYKNCAALTGIEYLRKVVGCKLGEVLMWVWVEDIARDLKTIFSRKEELDKMDSFLPYIASMHLAKKSPYSAVHCPNLHYFVHMTAAFIGQQRSLKARMVGDTNTLGAMFNAAVFAYAKANRAGWSQQFRLLNSTNVLKKVKPIEEDTTLDEETPSGQPEPDDSDPRKWWRYISQFKSRLPDQIIEANAAKARMISSPRQGTIGEYLRNWATSLND